MPSKPLFLFDLDGTVTRVELLPRIAERAGIERQMRVLTEATIAGKVPFEDSLRDRVKLLGGLDIGLVRDVCTGAPLNERLVAFMQENREHCAIVTGNLDVWIGGLAERIGVRLFCSKAQVEGAHVVGLEHILRKVTVLDELEDVAKGRTVVAIGDGHNDAELIERAHVGIAYGGVHSPAQSVLEVCTHAIYDEATLCRFLRRLS